MRSTLVCFLFAGVFLHGCAPGHSVFDTGTAQFSFSYEVQNGLDCHMMGSCGFSLVLSTDRMLRHRDDQGEITKSVLVSEGAVDSLSALLRENEFFTLPSVLPDIPEEDIPRGGRTVTMTHTSDSTETSICAYTDVTSTPIPEQFFHLDENVRTYLVELLETN